MLNALFIAALAALQAPAAQQGSQQDPSAGQVQPPLVPVGLVPSGVQAPTQPVAASTSTWTRDPRFAPLGLSRPAGDQPTPIASLVAVRGQEDNAVMGIGLVVGLQGTGDSIEAARRLLSNLLLTRNINLDLQSLSSKNIAIVQVEATLPAGAKPGRRIDATVSAIGDSTSLQGGVLAFTELTDASGRVVWATASGPITVGGFTASGEAAKATKNHTTVGTLSNGGKCEREVPTSIVSEHGWVHLDLRSAHDSLGNAVRIAESVNAAYPGSAECAADGKTIKVRVPADLPTGSHAAFVDGLLRRGVVSDDVARVVINERTGTIVMGGDVRLRPGAIAQGAITVTIAETPEASQPGPLSAGQTVVLPRTDIAVAEQDNALVATPGATTLQEVVDVLNVLGATPRELITILQAMAQGGLLQAEIRRM
jgi:flagellar P-ring protein precursor FlgI